MIPGLFISASESEQQPESQDELVVFGKRPIFSDRPVRLEENRSDSGVIIENIDPDIAQQKKIALITIHSHLGADAQSGTHINRIEVVVQDSIGQHEGFPGFIFKRKRSSTLQEKADSGSKHEGHAQSSMHVRAMAPFRLGKSGIG